MPKFPAAHPNVPASHSFVMRVSARDADPLGKVELSIRVVHVNSNVTKRFVSTKSAYDFITQTIDRFVLRPLH